jgi:hypothetical protein
VRIDVYQLARRELAVESFGKRAQQPYLSAFEELAKAVQGARNDAGIPCDSHYEHVRLTVICYVGKGSKSDGFYRPRQCKRLWLLLDPIYWALGADGITASDDALHPITVELVRGAPREGFRIIVDELPEAS